MPNLLLELYSEEIPARMQRAAEAQLREKMVAALKEARLEHGEVKTFVSPQHLAITITDLPVQQPDRTVERKGPKVDAPEKALEGFLKSTGLSKDQLEQRELDKGTFFFAVMEEKGTPTAEALKPLIEEILQGFHWPKSMRWGDGTLQWARPLHSIVCLLDSEVIPVEFHHIMAGNVTYGHRFMASGAITLASPDEYEKALLDAKVIVDAEARKTAIRDGIKKATDAAELTIVEDEGLLNEVTGLVEWPVILLGEFDKDFMRLPPEVLVSEMREHQKYFACQAPGVRNPESGNSENNSPLIGESERSSIAKTDPVRGAMPDSSLPPTESHHDSPPPQGGSSGSLSNHFIVTSNVETADDGAAIVHGNGRVLRARLSDGAFFWDQDRAKPLNDWATKLDDVIFHAKLGSIGEKSRRVASLATLLAVFVPHANLTQVKRAAELCKADLVTGMVGEFPDLQGVMGRYYALDQDEPQEVADAIRDHYMPVGADAPLPDSPVSMTLALADKMDTLMGLFAIGDKPTGSKDPFALRRAALGILRIIIDHKLRIPLRILCDHAAKQFGKKTFATTKEETIDSVMAFFAERLRVMLRDQGVRHDVVAAVFDEGKEDDMVRLVAKSYALANCLKSDDGANLLAAYKRASNILEAEEKKDNVAYNDKVDVKRLEAPEEKTLYEAMEKAQKPLEAALENEAFGEAMQQLAGLRAPLDAYFNAVMVNAEDNELRKNRLYTLHHLRHSIKQMANFDVIEGT